LFYVLQSKEKVIAGGDKTWYRVSPCYRHGLIPLVARQMSLTFEVNARGDDGWMQSDYQVSSVWKKIGEMEARSLEGICFNSRPVPKLIMKERVATQIVAQGFFKRESPANTTVAEQMQQDYLSCR
jgi:hypothetical protein